MIFIIHNNAKLLNNSQELKDEIFNESKNYDSKTGEFKSDKLEIEFKNDKNLQYSFGHMTILNPIITPDGYFEGLGFDKYNFEWILKNLLSETTLLNNAATILQYINFLKNYFIFVPIKFKIS